MCITNCSFGFHLSSHVYNSNNNNNNKSWCGIIGIMLSIHCTYITIPLYIVQMK